MSVSGVPKAMSVPPLAVQPVLLVVRGYHLAINANSISQTPSVPVAKLPIAAGVRTIRNVRTLTMYVTMVVAESREIPARVHFRPMAVLPLKDVCGAKKI